MWVVSVGHDPSPLYLEAPALPRRARRSAGQSGGDLAGFLAILSGESLNMKAKNENLNDQKKANGKEEY